MQTQTLALKDFKEILSNGHWTHKQEINHIDTIDRITEEYLDDGELVQHSVDHSYGQAIIESTNSKANFTIKYTEGYSYDEYEKESFCACKEGQDYTWEFIGFEVLDDDGYTMRESDIVDLLSYEFSSVDYDDLIASIDQVVNVDGDERKSDDYSEFCLRVDNKPDLSFTGLVLGEASSHHPYDRNDKWTELTLYETKGGKFVCHEVYRTKWIGDRNRYTAKVCETLEEVKEFFGYGWLAKELYESAEMQATQNID